ncbi:MAG TPA: SRPBCC domain-containing protein [Porticoccus sp.]|nr:SRPBCC domain-containing protein [Porticoccus sp.]
MFSLHIETSIDIDASAEAIWAALTDFPAYNNWNPMLRDVKTQLGVGEKVTFSVMRTETKKLKLNAKITDLQPNQCLTWRGGHHWFLGGEHYFRIEPLDGKCRFHHGELFSGVLLPLAMPILKDADALYAAMNNDLKRRVEEKPL